MAKPIYRGMDKAALDAAYNNSAAVADSADYLARWRQRSEAVRAMAGTRLDVAYGEAPRARLDYLPAGKRNAPLFVFIHGGYWQRNHKDIFAFVAEGPHAHGIDVATIGYTLAPQARLTDIVREVDAALAFLARNAVQFGFDTQKIYVGGWSAGGHLAACMGRHAAVRGALPISGIFDLEPIALTYLDEALTLSRAEIETLSPLRLLAPGTAPVSLAVGGDELSELKRQSADFKAKADSLGLPVTLRVLPGHHHFSILEELARPDGALTRDLLALIGKA